MALGHMSAGGSPPKIACADPDTTRMHVAKGSVGLRFKASRYAGLIGLKLRFALPISNEANPRVI